MTMAEQRPTGEIDYTASEWWKKRPQEMGKLNPHIAKKLVRAGFNSPAAVRAAGEDRIGEIEGIGKVALAEISEWLCSLEEDQQ